MPETFKNNNNKFSAKPDAIEEKVDSTLPDLTYLKEMAEGDEVFFNEIINHFLENAPKSLILLRECAASEDYEKLRFTAHKLLPQLTFVGILAAVDDVRKIENECRLMEDLPEVIERTITTVNKGIESLKKMI